MWSMRIACLVLLAATSTARADYASERRAELVTQCAADDGFACRMLAHGYLQSPYEEPLGVRYSPKRALELYTRACSLRDGESCSALLSLEIVGESRATRAARRRDANVRLAKIQLEWCIGGDEDLQSCIAVARRLRTGDGLGKNPRLAGEIEAKIPRLEAEDRAVTEMIKKNW